MRTLRLMVCSVVVVLLAVPAAHSDVYWDWDVQPLPGAALPGQTIQWTYDITNLTQPGGNSLIVLPADPATWDSSFTQAVNAGYIDLSATGSDFDPIGDFGGTVAPQQTVHGDFYQLTWSNTAPLGTTVTGGMFIAVGNRDAIPPLAYVLPVGATCTPELPPSALGLLSCVPFAIWRIWLRRRGA